MLKYRDMIEIVVSNNLSISFFSLSLLFFFLVTDKGFVEGLYRSKEFVYTLVFFLNRLYSLGN